MLGSQTENPALGPMSDGMSASTPVGTVVYIGIASISYSLVPGGRAADLMLLSKNIEHAKKQQQGKIQRRLTTLDDAT